MALFESRKPNAGSPPPPASPKPPVPPKLVPMEDLLRLVIDEGASDLHISVGAPPALRINGKLVKLQLPPLAPEDTETLARAVTSDANLQRVTEEGSVDFAFSYRGQDRFRGSVYRQKGHLGLALRTIPKKMLTLAQIGLPQSVEELLFLPRGLILVTGPTGSGKTTTLASMIDLINTRSAGHIMTIEDPIKYYHPHKLGILNQREVGVDVPTFPGRLAPRPAPAPGCDPRRRNALDLDTMETAFHHRRRNRPSGFLSTLLHNGRGAHEAPDFIDAFPTTQQEQIRRAIIDQPEGGHLAIIAADASDGTAGASRRSRSWSTRHRSPLSFATTKPSAFRTTSSTGSSK